MPNVEFLSSSIWRLREDGSEGRAFSPAVRAVNFLGLLAPLKPQDLKVSSGGIKERIPQRPEPKFHASGRLDQSAPSTWISSEYT